MGGVGGRGGLVVRGGGGGDRGSERERTERRLVSQLVLGF